MLVTTSCFYQASRIIPERLPNNRDDDALFLLIQEGLGHDLSASGKGKFLFVEKLDSALCYS